MTEPKKEDGFWLLHCPHCQGMIQVKETEMACGIFRHGIIKTTYQPVPPHAPKQLCDELVRDNKILGCGKPFRFANNQVSICDYI